MTDHQPEAIAAIARESFQFETLEPVDFDTTIATLDLLAAAAIDARRAAPNDEYARQLGLFALTAQLSEAYDLVKAVKDARGAAAR